MKKYTFKVTITEGEDEFRESVQSIRACQDATNRDLLRVMGWE